MSVRCAVTPLAPGSRVLPRDASHYLCRVLRLGQGDRFVAFDPTTKQEADAVVDGPSGEAANVTIGHIRTASVLAGVRIALVYGLAKGDKVDAVVRDATELGATHIVIARTARAVAKATGDRQDAKLDRWRRIAEQAARQCGRTDPPAIEGVLPWKAALEAAAKDHEARYCLWENATAPLADTLLERVRAGTSLAFAVGPEGGLSEAEVEEARALGFATVSIGRFILRTETVPAAVLGAVRILEGN
ncbi:MAG TPA: 16S rRNA (uracil(1498)-N(3))-methyltransferase [Labilithrix sp.]|nr:16S rRNA (uracil(1498)-N(3))-methyltransferase [Labilithrix sp.]